MKSPIVITESYDISVHPSVEHVELFLEPVDVWDGIYIAYDSDGHLLNLTLDIVERECHFLWLKWTARYEGAIIISDHDPPIDRSAEL